MAHLDHAELGALLHDAPDHVLSLYLHVDPTDVGNLHAVPQWRRELDQALNGLAENLPEDQRPRLDAARARLDSWLLDHPVGGKTLVMFATADMVSATSLPFALPVLHEFGPPRVDPLLWAVDEYQHYLVVLVDRDRVRTVSAYLGSPQANEPKLEPDGDWAAKHFTRTGHRDKGESHAQDWQHRWLRAIAQELGALALAKPDLGRIILAGDDKQAKALRQELPLALRRAVIGVVPIPFDLEDHEVIERAQPLAIAYERKVELDIVRAVLDAAATGDRGAVGDQAVGEALDAHQVRRLILATPVEDPRQAADWVRRSFACAAEVEFVSGEAASFLRENGKQGVAADLYWS